ncbi:MAG: DoxX family protein [Gemmatimonadaceae bacterium]|nr:DoxX family protein [Gemmatimonadaceae bacterium]
MDAQLDQRFRIFAQTALRVAAGFTFLSHGGQKFMGWFGGFGPGGGSADMMSRFGVAGTIEFFAGICIILGLFTRPIAFIVSGEMAVAYFWMHFGSSGQIWWWRNGGEVVLLYSFLWLLFAAWGAGPVSLDAWLRSRKAAA